MHSELAFNPSARDPRQRCHPRTRLAIWRRYLTFLSMLNNGGLKGMYRMAKTAGALHDDIVYALDFSLLG
jgi:hypothetical protein